MCKTSKALFFCSDKHHRKQGHWSKEEHIRFLEGCYLHKNNWPKIEEYIQTRSIPQIRSHAQKFLIKICRKYEIKLSQKKFPKTKSKHLELAYAKSKKNKKTGIAHMNKYERNIYEMFNYYKRDSLHNNADVNKSKSNSEITISTNPDTNDCSKLNEEKYYNLYCHNNNMDQCISQSYVAFLVYLYVFNHLLLIHQLCFPFAVSYDNYCLYVINVLHILAIYGNLNGK